MQAQRLVIPTTAKREVATEIIGVALLLFVFMTAAVIV